MNMQEPFMTAQQRPDGTRCVLVNWLYPGSDLARFTLETIQKGPFPEAHYKVRLAELIMILKTSEMEN